jgi:hypothetical protein
MRGEYFAEGSGSWIYGNGADCDEPKENHDDQLGPSRPPHFAGARVGKDGQTNPNESCASCARRDQRVRLGSEDITNRTFHKPRVADCALGTPGRPTTRNRRIWRRGRARDYAHVHVRDCLNARQVWKWICLDLMRAADCACFCFLAFCRGRTSNNEPS